MEADSWWWGCRIKAPREFQLVRILGEDALFGEFLLLCHPLLLLVDQLALVLEVFPRAVDEGEPFLKVGFSLTIIVLIVNI
ncbi:MAG: hypothetical protein CL911_03540 [Deltaproteobacteria bacterium]|nr:hypothetical protein [Deltaproteobacteria bacterium]